VATRSDLDTPAGARDFQRYLIGKLRDIRAVVAGASLDDTSNSALMAAWTSLYNSTQPDADCHRRPAAGRSDPSPLHRRRTPSKATRLQRNPTSTRILTHCPRRLGPPPRRCGADRRRDVQHSVIRRGRPAGRCRVGDAGGIGGARAPAGGDEQLSPKELDDARLKSDEPEDRLVSDEDDPNGPTMSTPSLPPGRRPRRCPTARRSRRQPTAAAAIEAAASGTPIADAFRQEGMTIPPPGTAGQRFRWTHRSSRPGTSACSPTVTRLRSATAGAGEWPDPAHLHRERPWLPRLGAPSGAGQRTRTGQNPTTGAHQAGDRPENRDA